MMNLFLTFLGGAWLKQTKVFYGRAVKRLGVFTATFIMMLSVAQSAWAIPAQVPLFLTNPIVPIMMLNLSKDHQLYFKAYDDYSDITDSNLLDSGGSPNANYGLLPDGIADTSYVNGYSYFGYFDNAKCYVFKTAGTRFEPNSAAVNHYCNGAASEWSGNFLNWATMTRMDVVRKILYGGYRSTDSATETVLERAFITADAHAFAKYYDGNDINKLTPFNPPALQTGTAATGITICNVSIATSGYSQAISTPPLMRVAKGNYKFWASNERWQCRWYTEKNQTLSSTSGSNGNTFAASGDYGYKDNPPAADKLLESGVTGAGLSEYYVRVKACVPPLSANESPVGSYGECYSYPSGNIKPVGLLQQFGEPGVGGVAKINFGLITGSYAKNKSGGVLRKNVGNMANEINYTTDGIFKTQPATGGVIGTLDALRLFGYDYSNGLYNNSSPGDNCPYGISSFSDSICSNWGNPQSEIFLESLRYLYGATAASPKYSASDSSYFAALKNPAWVKPVANANYCAPLNVLQFNGSSSSYDDDFSGTPYSSATDIGMSGAGTDVATWTDKVGTNNGLDTKSWFFGVLRPAAYSASSSTANGLCTAKTLTSLSKVSGTCTDAPRLEGSYNIAGLAYYARSKGYTPTGVTDTKGVPVNKTVRTYAVALAPSVPKVEVAIPSSLTGQKVIIQPACQNTAISGNCAIVDFKILGHLVGVTLTNTGDASVDGQIGNQGRLYVNWEDSEQGGDYDQDMWGLIDYAVTATKVVVRTSVIAQSTGNKMGFGYILTGTNSDGFKVHAGINNYTDTNFCTGGAGNACTCRTSGTFGSCNSSEASHTQTYATGTSAANSLKPPLFYAAKWGGYSDDFEKKSTSLTADLLARDPTGDSYYYSTNPQELKDNLTKAFTDISEGVGSASAVATNSTHLSENTFVYQAQFNSTTWTGTLNAYMFDSNGNLPSTPNFISDNTMPTSGAGRSVYTFNGTSLVNFNWSNLTTAQQLALRRGAEVTDVNAMKRVDWILGNATYESVAGGLRDRGVGLARNILGDIVNSSPAYVGAQNQWFDRLPGTEGSTYRAYLATKKTKAALLFVGSNDGMVHVFDANDLTEKYTFIPNLSFLKIANITAPDYGKSSNPHQYIVDGPITVSDVYINGYWRTILVGTMGAGGRGIYALDITDPTPQVLFEIDPTTRPEIGYVMGKPIIAPMANGRWAVIFGNGDSSGGTSQLFVVDIESPTSSYTRVIDTGSGTGLSAPSILPDPYGRVLAVYAGDINGNMWRFDLSDTNQSNWKKDYKVFVAKDASNNVQAIVAAPTLGLNFSKNGKVMLYFGTGKYYDTTDNMLGTTTNSFYAIADVGSTVTRSQLSQKTLTTNSVSTPPTRIVNESNPNWSTQNGWYLDFSETVGERVSTPALLFTDKLIFPTLTPSIIPCDFGGTSWLMEVVAVGDKYAGQHVISDNEYNKFLVLGDLGIGLVPSPDPTKKLPTDPIDPLDGGCGKAKIMSSGSSGVLIAKDGKVQCELVGRQAWRQIR